MHAYYVHAPKPNSPIIVSTILCVYIISQQNNFCVCETLIWVFPHLLKRKYTHLLAVCYWLLTHIFGERIFKEKYISIVSIKSDTCIFKGHFYDLYQSARKIWITALQPPDISRPALHFLWFTTLGRAYMCNLYLLCVARVNGFLSTLRDKVKHKSACRTRCKRARWNYYLLLITVRTLVIIKREKCLWPTHTPFTRHRIKLFINIFTARR